MRANVEKGKCKIGALLHFIGKNKRKKCFSKKLKVTGIKCRNKSDNNSSQEEKVAKDARFQSQLLISARFPSCEFSSFKPWNQVPCFKVFMSWLN